MVFALVSVSINCKGSEISVNGEKNRAVAFGLAILAVVAVVGLVAGNKKIREKLNERSNELTEND